MYSVEQRNLRFHLVSNVFYIAASSFLAESYVQTYLLRLGVTEGGISAYGYASQVAAMIAYALFSGVNISKPGMWKRIVSMGFAMGVLPAALLLAGQTEGKAALGAALTGVVIFGFVSAYKSSGDYAIMPCLFRREQYARVSGLSGIFGGVAAALISLTANAMLRGGASYTPLFSMGVVLMMVSAWFYARLQPVAPESSAPEVKTGGREVLARINTPAYRKMMWPHLLRGIVTGAMYYFVLTGYRNISLNDAQSTFLITVSVVTNMVGCFVFIRVVRRIRSGTLLLIAYSVCAIGMLAVPWVRTVGGFFALYIIYMIALVITQYSVPYGVLRSTKNEDLALISSSRMFVHNGDAALFIFLFGIIMNRASPVWVMACGAAASLIAGLQYKKQYRDELR